MVGNEGEWEYFGWFVGFGFGVEVGLDGVGVEVDGFEVGIKVLF